MQRKVVFKTKATRGGNNTNFYTGFMKPFQGWNSSAKQDFRKIFMTRTVIGHRFFCIFCAVEDSHELWHWLSPMHTYLFVRQCLVVEFESNMFMKRRLWLKCAN